MRAIWMATCRRVGGNDVYTLLSFRFGFRARCSGGNEESQRRATRERARFEAEVEYENGRSGRPALIPALQLPFPRGDLRLNNWDKFYMRPSDFSFFFFTAVGLLFDSERRVVEA